MGRKIFTHVNPDLDAWASYWAVRKFIEQYRDALLVLRPANWDGGGMTEFDIAVDLYAGGRGIKGDQLADGIHASFKKIVETYCPADVQRALRHVIKFVDWMDTFRTIFGKLEVEIPEEVRTLLMDTNILTIVNGLSITSHGDINLVAERVCVIFDAIYEVLMSRQRAENEVSKAILLDGGAVAIMRNAKEHATEAMLYARGVRIMVYEDGNNLGVVRSSREKFSIDHPIIRTVIEQAGERIGNEGWFAHPSGFLLCRGSRKNPATTRSNVQAVDLALAAVELLKTIPKP